MSWFLKALGSYATFSGRARRREFWFFVLFNIILSVVALVIDQALGSGQAGIFSLIVFLGLIIPGWTVAVRRLHDTGRSGWWILIGIIPLIGAIVLLVFYLLDSQPGSNQYGPSPKALTA